MKTVLVVIGKTDNKHINACISDYVGRIGHYLQFEMVVLPDIKNTKKFTVEQLKHAEGKSILNQFKQSDHVVLLDEHGDELRSIDFAKWLQKKQMAVKRLVFVIGGPYGFSDMVYERANEKLSLSQMTFSHQMVRMIFTEQIYRACTIIKGEPYHHE